MHHRVSIQGLNRKILSRLNFSCNKVAHFCSQGPLLWFVWFLTIPFHLGHSLGEKGKSSVPTTPSHLLCCRSWKTLNFSKKSLRCKLHTGAQIKRKLERKSDFEVGGVEGETIPFLYVPLFPSFYCIILICKNWKYKQNDFLWSDGRAPICDIHGFLLHFAHSSL